MTPQKPFTENFLVMLENKKSCMDGNTTISLPKRLVVPLKEMGVNVGRTVEKFLESLLEEVEAQKKKGAGKE